MYRRIQTGQVPAVRLGDGPCGPLRVDAGDLERWIYRDKHLHEAKEQNA